MPDNIFITSKIKRPRQTDQILKEFDTLDAEVREFTNERGRIELTDITSEQAKSLFGSNSRYVGESSFLVDFKYTLTDENNNEYKYRNRLGCISFNNNFPLYGISFLSERTGVERNETQEDLQKFIKKMVETISFRRSLFRAKDGIKTTPKLKIKVHKTTRNKKNKK
ncbi:hypothetical protein [Fibrobacter sp.]|uniref:hypothetical protein n=1 Tax=Fibrobacter sp. TaxID=35828 RepID=UPI00388F2C59